MDEIATTLEAVISFEQAVKDYGPKEIGPVTFVYIDDITTSEFYPAGPTPDVLAKHSFDTLLELMRETHASWLARVAVEGCEQQRAEEIGELAVDLAIV